MEGGGTTGAEGVLRGTPLELCPAPAASSVVPFDFTSVKKNGLTACTCVFFFGSLVARASQPTPPTRLAYPALCTAGRHWTHTQGLREAHVRDGVALTAFLSWLERAMDAGADGGGGGIGWPLTEFTVAEKLDCFRWENRRGYFESMHHRLVQCSAAGLRSLVRVLSEYLLALDIEKP